MRHAYDLEPRLATLAPQPSEVISTQRTSLDDFLAQVEQRYEGYADLSSIVHGEQVLWNHSATGTVALLHQPIGADSLHAAPAENAGQRSAPQAYAPAPAPSAAPYNDYDYAPAYAPAYAPTAADIIAEHAGAPIGPYGGAPSSAPPTVSVTI